MAEILGLDIGGSGIKAAPVDTDTGELTGERFRLPTPQPPAPENVIQTVGAVVEHFRWQGPIGAGFPGVVKHGVVYTANNLHPAWIGRNAETDFNDVTGCPVAVGNDADAAALAEIKFGAGRNVSGLLVVITLGTGIGSGMAINGRLVPNSEFGQLYMASGVMAEPYASESAKKRDDINSREWGQRINEYLKEVERLVYPDLIILGGGGSKKFEKFQQELTLETPVLPAELRNLAGIVGAALLFENARESMNATIPG